MQSKNISPKGYLMSAWRIFVRMMKDQRGFAGEGETPLPDAIASDEAFKDIGTVEKLAEGFKASQGKTFIDFMPEEARKDPSITKYKTGEDLFKGHKNLIEMIGKKGVVLPAEGASEEEMGKFYNLTGRPEKAEGYKFTKVENLHPDIKVTPEGEKAFKDIVHKLGLNNKQADGLNAAYFTLMSNALIQKGTDEKTTRDNAINALKAEWPGGKYDENVHLAKRLLKVFGGDETATAFGDLGNKPEVLKLLAGVGKKLSEDSINNLGGVDLLADTGTAKKRIDEIAKELIKLDSGAPGYNDLVKERTRLYKVAYPNE